jgi:cysteine dioxygenase
LTSSNFEQAERGITATLLRHSVIEHEDLRGHLIFDPSRYTRNLVFRNAHFELLILCWSPGSASPVHDHGGAQCFMKVYSGSLRVEEFTILSGGRRQGYAHIAPSGSTVMSRGAIDVRTTTRDLHRVAALREEAISVHVYAKPLDRFLIFNPGHRSCRTVFGRYDSLPAIQGCAGGRPDEKT